MAALALLCTAAAPALAQQPAQKPQEQEKKEHVVRKGDTLWDLARFYFNDPFRWPTIFDANRKVVENPHWIYPAEMLVIPGGDPKLLGREVAMPVAEPVPEPEPETQRTRFYTAPPQGESTVVSSQRDLLSLVQPDEWLAAPWIADSASLHINASVLRSADPRNQRDKLAPTFHPRDELFLGTVGSHVRAGDRLLAVRLTRNLRGLGWVVEPQAVLQIDSVAPNTARAQVMTQFGDLKVGDLAMPLPQVPTMPKGSLTEVTGGPRGEVIDFFVAQPLVGTTEYTFVNLRSDQGLAIGDELVVYIPERQPTERRPEKLPEQSVALLRVIKVNDKAVTARVVRLYQAALEKGLPVRVARKAP